MRKRQFRRNIQKYLSHLAQSFRHLFLYVEILYGGKGSSLAKDVVLILVITIEPTVFVTVTTTIVTDVYVDCNTATEAICSTSFAATVATTTTAPAYAYRH